MILVRKMRPPEKNGTTIQMAVNTDTCIVDHANSRLLAVNDLHFTRKEDASQLLNYLTVAVFVVSVPSMSILCHGTTRSTKRNPDISASFAVFRPALG